MNWDWLPEVTWQAIVAFCIGVGLSMLGSIRSNIFDIKLSANYLRGIGTSLEDIARSLGRIARALETLAANSRTYVQIKRTRGD